MMVLVVMMMIVMVVMLMIVMVVMITMKHSQGHGGGDFSDAQKMLNTGHQGKTHTEILHAVTDSFISYII
jgi:preprotein translocase subunit SecG